MAEVERHPPAGEVKLKQRQSHMVSPAQLQQLAHHRPALEELVASRPRSPPGSASRSGQGPSGRTPSNEDGIFSKVLSNESTWSGV